MALLPLCMYLSTRLTDRLHSERGATAVEYGLMVALIAAVIVGVVATLGTEIQGAFQTVIDQMPGSGTTE